MNSEPYQFFELSDDVGGTPDALVGEFGCLEVKCPYTPAVHINTLLNRTVPREYLWQVHGHILVTGRDWCDFVSFDPRLEHEQDQLCVIHVERDQKMIDSLTKRLDSAVEFVAKQVSRLQGRR